jgi:dipeptidyl aminopeptidase/acylaminoacyl peptidase
MHIVTRPRPRARGGVATVDTDGRNLRSRYLSLHVSGATWAPEGWPLILKPETTDNGRPGTERSQLLRLGALEAGPDVLLKRRGYISGPAYSPDGSRIAFTVVPEGPSASLWIVSPSGGKPRLLLENLLDPYFSWSPNGRELALSASFPKQGRHGLFLVSVASGNARLLTSEPLAERRPPTWAPDGRWITFAGAGGSVSKIRRDGTGRQRLFELPGEKSPGSIGPPTAVVSCTAPARLCQLASAKRLRGDSACALCGP